MEQVAARSGHAVDTVTVYAALFLNVAEAVCWGVAARKGVCSKTGPLRALPMMTCSVSRRVGKNCNTSHNMSL
jgi:hypothetical protein